MASRIVETSLPALVLFVSVPAAAPAAASPAADAMRLEDYQVVWDSPSADARGSMPLGNGDLALNAWVEADGDLRFYIGKSDAWDDNNRLLKVGRVRVALSPNPFAKGGTFRQELRLRGGEMVVTAAAPGADAPVEIRLWADANRPVIHVTVDARTPVAAAASFEPWRTAPETLRSLECSDIFNAHPKPPPTVVEPDTVLKDLPDGIGWYHRNVKSVGPELTMAFQDLAEAPWKDPLLHRTFGALIRAEGGKRVDDRRLESPKGSRHRFSVYVLTKQPATEAEWLAGVREIAKAAEAVDFDARRKAHLDWWEAFWNRSRLFIRDRGAGARESAAPANAHPLKIGVDQGGGSRFAGEIARASLLRAALADRDLRALAGGDRRPLAGPDVVASRAGPAAGDALDVKPGDLAGAFTIEAWIRPGDQDGGGRIFDKITPGGSDGFLLDTWPGHSLRLIAGQATLVAKGALKAGTWHHVAAVLEGGAGRLYLDGKRLAGDAPSATPPGHDVARGYTLQRFITACAGRGAYPIKFNGSLFVMPWPGKEGDGDYRRWGPGYWWQNTRLPYISSCAAGDYDLMAPLFNMYGGEVLAVSKYRTQRYFGFEGAYFPECIYPWGAVFMESYGWGRPAAEREDKLQVSGWHKWEWVCGPELVFMMQDYYDHTLDDRFLADRLLPTARAVLAFFDHFYKTNEQGRLVMHPAQAVETWWKCTNPMPELAGLHAVTDRLLALPEGKLSAENRRFVEALRKKLPDLPTREEKGIRMLAPAEQFADKRNCENPELYAVFPFRLCSFEKPNAELGIQALLHRWDRGDSGWRQDDIFMAYLGLARDAKANVVRRARQQDPACRFPAFWGPNYDWTPDQDHGGVLMKAVQAMLLQTEGRRIFLLPAWPKEWDADFKLHAPYRTVVEGTVRDGKIASLTVTPEERRRDVTVMAAQ